MIVVACKREHSRVLTGCVPLEVCLAPFCVIDDEQHVLYVASQVFICLEV